MVSAGFRQELSKLKLRVSYCEGPLSINKLRNLKIYLIAWKVRGILSLI